MVFTLSIYISEIDKAIYYLENLEQDNKKVIK